MTVVAGAFCTPDAMPTGNDLLSDYERAYCTSFLQGLLVALRSLSDSNLLSVARDPHGVEFGAVMASLPRGTDPERVTVHAACAAADRDLISDRELAALTC